MKTVESSSPTCCEAVPTHRLTLRDILFFPDDADPRAKRPHMIWHSVMLTLLGIAIGLLALIAGAAAPAELAGSEMFLSYFRHPLLLLLNLLMPVLLIWLFYLISGHAWIGYLVSALPCLAAALVNYYKIRLRGDPLLAVDILVAGEAGNAAERYSFDLNGTVLILAGCFLLGLLFAVFFLRRGIRHKMGRLIGSLAIAAATAASLLWLYPSQAIYNATENYDLINRWSDTEVYVSKGMLYPFLHSVKDMLPSPPDGYDAGEGKALLQSFSDADIPAGQKIDTVGIMLEAFCDLTDFAALSDIEEVRQVYAPWHAWEEKARYGDLLTNIFVGGTVDSEWGYLTGYSAHDKFRSPTDSYVWYFKEQGYATAYHHPGYNWFYNRRNVNEYLGFEESFFSENYYLPLVDPVAAVWRSDKILVDSLLEELNDENPQFLFSVSYQNHGPYLYNNNVATFVTPENSHLSAESCTILNSYLDGIADTVAQMDRLLCAIEEREQPTVVVLFGDHKPWLGNGNSVYTEMGVTFSRDTLPTFAEYYGTPYLIYVNSAAREVLDGEFTGRGAYISPCYLMAELFDTCGWEGPAFMQLARQMRDISPLLHTADRYLIDGILTDSLPSKDTDFHQKYLWAQYYREKHFEK